MAIGRCLFCTSFIIAGIAVFLVVDVCKPYREVLKRLTPPVVGETMDDVADKIRTLTEQIVPEFEDKSPDTASTSSTESKTKKTKTKSATPILFTKDELKEYDGSKGSKGLYLGILGRVFDVSRGSKHYGPGGGYSFFTGCDGTKAFITGEFDDKGLVDDVTGLSNAALLDLNDWLKFYRNDYKYIGKVIGNFYDQEGKPTEALKEFNKGVKEGKKAKALEDDDLRKYPSCNSEWSKDSGSRVWCSDKSGGIERDWIGVPRAYHKPGKHTRCACIRTFGPPTDNPDADTDYGDLQNPQFRLYEGCSSKAVSCKMIK